jgi:hypothetical protein
MVDISWKYINGSTTEKFILYRSGPDGGTRRMIKEFAVSAASSMFNFQDTKVQRGKLYVYEVELCTDGSGCEPFGERQPVFFRPKGGNKESTGDFASTSHSNEYNKQIFPYKKPLVHFDMGGSLDLNEMLEIYTAPLEATPIIKARLNANDAKWFWQDLAPASEALYQFKVCNTETGFCNWSPMQTYVQFYPEPGYSVFHNYLPNYVQVQFTCDGTPPPGAYYQITKSLSKNGGVIKAWKIEAPNVPNGDCRLPKEDREVQLDGTYYYNIYFVNNGNRSVIKENIEVKY